MGCRVFVLTTRPPLKVRPKDNPPKDSTLEKRDVSWGSIFYLFGGLYKG